MTSRKPASNRCVHHRYARDDTVGDPVAACAVTTPGDTFGVLVDEGLTGSFGCAVEAANEAARLNGRCDMPGDAFFTWALLCAEHHKQPMQRLRGVCRGRHRWRAGRWRREERTGHRRARCAVRRRPRRVCRRRHPYRRRHGAGQLRRARDAYPKDRRGAGGALELCLLRLASRRTLNVES
ncbi:hypothetical protein GCM10020000_85050 [Streptomyces olivoverticillatus]